MSVTVPGTLRIDGVDYDAPDRAARGLKINSFTKNLSGGYDLLAFHEDASLPTPSWDEWVEVTLTLDLGDGSVLQFSGLIGDTQSQYGRLGWTHGYTAYGKRFLCDKLVAFEANDGTGIYTWNRPTSDSSYYVASDAGLSLGTIITRALTIPATARRLDAVGVGGYTSLTPPTLPTATVNDLALLTVVPPQPVTFQGKNVLGQIDQHIARWMPKFVQNLLPTGVLRFKDTTSLTVFIPRTVTLPSGLGSGDPVRPIPRVRRSSKDCATRMVVRGGPEVELALLSLVDGTLAEKFTSTNKTDWTYYDFVAPKGSSDYGTIISCTSTSATLHSHDATTTWAINFWSSRQAKITLIDNLATGLSEFESRPVTSNAALTAGGNAAVTWDSSWPISTSTYTNYRIVGQAGGDIDTWRLYEPREPHTGATGLSTYVGSHLVRYSPLPVKWSNTSRSYTEHTSQGAVVGPGGVTVPSMVEVVPGEGAFRFTQPTVSIFGQAASLYLGSPTTVADGLPADVQVLALYSRGSLSVTVPPDVGGVPQYDGDAASVMEVTEYLDVTSWLLKNDTASMVELARQHLDTMNNLEYDFTVNWDLDSSGVLPAWDWLDFSFAVNLAIAGTTSPWSSLNAPVRTITLEWNTSGTDFGGVQRIGFVCSTKRRPFTGDDLYIHPMFSGATAVGNLDGMSNMSSLVGLLPNYGAAMTPDLSDTQWQGGAVIPDAAGGNGLGMSGAERDQKQRERMLRKGNKDSGWGLEDAINALDAPNRGSKEEGQSLDRERENTKNAEAAEARNEEHERRRGEVKQRNQRQRDPDEKLLDRYAPMQTDPSDRMRRQAKESSGDDQASNLPDYGSPDEEQDRKKYT